MAKKSQDIVYKLLQKACTGDRDAYGSFVEMYLPKVKKWASGSEYIVSYVFINFWEYLKSKKNIPDNVEGYLFTIMRNLLADPPEKENGGKKGIIPIDLNFGTGGQGGLIGEEIIASVEPTAVVVMQGEECFDILKNAIFSLRTPLYKVYRLSMLDHSNAEIGYKCAKVIFTVNPVFQKDLDNSEISEGFRKELESLGFKVYPNFEVSVEKSDCENENCEWLISKKGVKKEIFIIKISYELCVCSINRSSIASQLSQARTAVFNYVDKVYGFPSDNIQIALLGILKGDLEFWNMLQDNEDNAEIRKELKENKSKGVIR